MKTTAHYLGIGIANLIEGLAPDTIIVGGPIVRAWPILATDLKAPVEAHWGPACGDACLNLVLASKFASVS